jgi:hypothetical protein
MRKKVLECGICGKVGNNQEIYPTTINADERVVGIRSKAPKIGSPGTRYDIEFLLCKVK